MIIQREMFDTMKAGMDREFHARVVAFVREYFDAAHCEPELETIVAAQIKRARSWGLTFETTIVDYVIMEWFYGIHFELRVNGLIDVLCSEMPELDKAAILRTIGREQALAAESPEKFDEIEP